MRLRRKALIVFIINKIDVSIFYFSKTNSQKIKQLVVLSIFKQLMIELVIKLTKKPYGLKTWKNKK